MEHKAKAIIMVYTTFFFKSLNISSFIISDWKALDAELEKLVEHIVDEFMEPQKNNLVPRSE